MLFEKNVDFAAQLHDARWYKKYQRYAFLQEWARHAGAD